VVVDLTFFLGGAPRRLLAGLLWCCKNDNPVELKKSEANFWKGLNRATE
jgi:hypothetical protein